MLWLDNWGWVGRDTQTKMIFSKYSMSMCFHTWKGGVVYWQRGEGPDSRHIAFHVADLISAVCDVWQSWFIWFISIYKVCEPMLPWVSHIIFLKSYFCFKAGIYCTLIVLLNCHVVLFNACSKILDKTKGD